MHLGIVGCHVPFLSHCDLDLCPSSNNYCVKSISHIIWDRNSKFGVSMYLGAVVWCTIYRSLWPLTYDLVFRIMVSGAYIIEGRNPKFSVGMQLWITEPHVPFWVTLILTSDLVCRIIVSKTYFLYNLRWESQIWCVDSSSDGGVSCTIYGSLWPWHLASFLE